MEGFQNKFFRPLFTILFRPKMVFGYRFHFEGKTDVWISQVRRVNTWNSWSYCNPRESDHDGGNSSFSSSSVVGKTKWFVDSCLCARTLDDWINVTRPIEKGIKINNFFLIRQQMALVLDLSYVRKSFFLGIKLFCFSR